MDESQEDQRSPHKYAHCSVTSDGVTSLDNANVALYEDVLRPFALEALGVQSAALPCLQPPLFLKLTCSLLQARHAGASQTVQHPLSRSGSLVCCPGNLMLTIMLPIPN